MGQRPAPVAAASAGPFSVGERSPSNAARSRVMLQPEESMAQWVGVHIAIFSSAGGWRRRRGRQRWWKYSPTGFSPTGGMAYGGGGWRRRLLLGAFGGTGGLRAVAVAESNFGVAGEFGGNGAVESLGLPACGNGRGGAPFSSRGSPAQRRSSTRHSMAHCRGWGQHQ